ncbi:uncharacterized protein G6M90_00g047160 [Metarhizium brunneum]|uniref:Uncharacterized protein n=1 Tax=Metarhizium brunneum TaxID=500148 RepID=A0A7D5Z0A3_9HYPO
MPSTSQTDHKPSSHSADTERTTFHNAHVSLSQDANSPLNESTELTQGSLPILLPRTYQPPAPRFQNKAISPGQPPDTPDPRFRLCVKIPCSDTNLSPISRLVSTSGAQHPRMEDGLRPGGIQSMCASIIGDATMEDISLRPNEAPSPGILFGPRRSPQGLADRRGLRTSSLDWKRYSSPQHHSFDARTNTPTHSRTVSSGSSTRYARDSLMSPVLYARYLENDPFTQGRHHSSSTSQEKLTLPTPIPDSPTLGHEHEESDLFADTSRDEIHEEQSFDLLKTYMRSRRNRTKHSNDGTAPPTSANQSATKTLGSKHRGVHWYSSSFALNKVKSHEAFTLLPQPSPASNQRIHSSRPPDISTLPLNYPFRKPAKTCGISDKSTALALQIFDTTSRLASVANKRDSILSITPRPNQSCDAQKQSCVPKPSRLGSLFSRHIRSGSSGSSAAEFQAPVANASSTNEKAPRDPGSSRDHVELQDESASVYSQPSMLETQVQEQHPRVASAGSYSYTTSTSSIAGIRDKLKLKMAPSQVKQQPGL